MTTPPHKCGWLAARIASAYHAAKAPSKPYDVFYLSVEFFTHTIFCMQPIIQFSKNDWYCITVNYSI